MSQDMEAKCGGCAGNSQGFHYSLKENETLTVVAGNGEINVHITPDPAADSSLVVSSAGESGEQGPGVSDQVPPPPLCPNGFLYTVKASDTLATIAARFGTTVTAILAANPQITDPDVIFAGQVICIPVPPPPPTCPNGFFYRVQPGDTLSGIAVRFGTTVSAILAANPQITDPDIIFAGQVVCIPVRPAPPTPPCPDGFLYTVRPGDTMFRIAQRFGVSLDALIRANPQIPNPDLIFPGQVLCVPRVVTPTCPDGFLYTVRPGDTMFLIARRFGISLQTLINANPQIPDPSRIFPGQVLCVPRRDP